MGEALAPAIASSVVAQAQNTFTPDAANVSTEFSFDVTGLPDGADVRPIAGEHVSITNRRVWVEGGRMQFDGNSEFRFGSADTARPVLLSNRDFLIKCNYITTHSGARGLFGLYDTASKRSFLLRTSADDLEFFASSDGTTFNIMFDAPAARNVAHDIELRRVGDTFTLEVDGVAETPFVASSGFTFFDPSVVDSTLRTHIGDYNNTSNNFTGSIQSISLEFLS
jgi:hypothetical protein